jgi:hypothetical protein
MDNTTKPTEHASYMANCGQVFRSPRERLLHTLGHKGCFKSTVVAQPSFVDSRELPERQTFSDGYFGTLVEATPEQITNRLLELEGIVVDLKKRSEEHRKINGDLRVENHELQEAVNSTFLVERELRGKLKLAEGAEESYLKQLAELEAILPPKYDRIHLGNCFEKCCPTCDTILLDYQRKLQKYYADRKTPKGCKGCVPASLEECRVCLGKDKPIVEQTIGEQRFENPILFTGGECATLKLEQKGSIFAWQTFTINQDYFITSMQIKGIPRSDVEKIK